MDEKIYLERQQRNKSCRTCLVESTSVSLFAVEGKTGEFYSDMLMFCASVQVWEDDGLPGKVCEKCAESIALMFAFKNLCEKSDRVLRKVSGRTKTNDYYDSDEEGEEEEAEEKVNWSETKLFVSEASTEQKKTDEESDGQLNEEVTIVTKQNDGKIIENEGCKNIGEEMQEKQSEETQNSVKTELQDVTENAETQKEICNEGEIHYEATNSEENSQAQQNSEDANYEETVNAILSIQEDPRPPSYEETRSSNYEDSRTSNNEDAGSSNNEDTRSSTKSVNNEDTRFSNNEDSRLSNNSASKNNEKTNNKKKRKRNDYVTETLNRHINYEDLGIHHFDDAENHEDTVPSQNFTDMSMQNYHYEASTSLIQNYDYNNHIQSTPRLPTYEDAVASLTYDHGAPAQHYQGENLNYEVPRTFIDISEVRQEVAPIQSRAVPNTQNSATLPQNVNQNKPSSEQNRPEAFETHIKRLLTEEPALYKSSSEQNGPEAFETHLKRLLTEDPAVYKSSPPQNTQTCTKQTESQLMTALLSNSNSRTHTQSAENKAVRTYSRRDVFVVPKPKVVHQTSQAALPPTSMQCEQHTENPQSAQILNLNQTQCVSNTSIQSSLAPVSYVATASKSTYNEGMYQHLDTATTNNLTTGLVQGVQEQSRVTIQTPMESIEIEDDDDDYSIDLTKDDGPSKSQSLLLSMLQSTRTSYKCELCDDQFPKIHLLKYHKQTVHKTTAAATKITVLDNVEINTASPKRQRIQCTLCKDSLCIHRLLTDTPESFQCNICGTLFENSLLLKQHLPTHATLSPISSQPYKPQAFVAPHGRKSISPSVPKQAQSTVDLQKKTFAKCTITNQLEGYRCVICGFTCTDNASCREHIQFHFKDIARLAFKCTTCNQICDSEKELQHHISNTHQSICVICGKNVTSRGMQRHYSQHIGEDCKHCGQKFGNEVENHKCQRYFKCECGKVFTTKYWYDIHRRVHHNSMFACDKCDFKCYSNKTLVQHKLKHVTHYVIT